MRKLLGVVAMGLCLTFSALAADVDALINQLKDKDNDARRAAAKALAEAGGDAKAAAPALVAALKDKDMFVRRFAAMALGEIGADPRDAVPGLKMALDDKKREVQEAAAAALGKMGGEAVGPLTKVVEDDKREPDVRRKAVESLGMIGAEARPAVKTLLDALKGGGGKKKMANPGEIRTEVVIALGNIASPGDKEVISAIEELTDSKKQRDGTLRKAAADALAKLKK
jgi:HEAT repeat protein